MPWCTEQRTSIGMVQMPAGCLEEGGRGVSSIESNTHNGTT